MVSRATRSPVRHYALHYQTGEPMPDDLKERMLKSINFQPAYALGENLAATCLDLAWHMLPSKDVPSAEKHAKFETEALKEVGLLNDQIPPRYRTSYFNHVWGGICPRLLQLPLDGGAGCQYRWRVQASWRA